MTTISAVIPTLNEAEGLEWLLPRLAKLPLDKIVVVDDNSNDDTDLVVIRERALWRKIMLLERKDDRGLSSAVRAGASICSSDYILTMDADGQHDPEDAREMLEIAYTGNYDIVVGSRFASGANLSGLSKRRQLLSRGLNFIANTRAQTKCSDPMTGFCIVRRDLLLQTQTNGFKFLYEILFNTKANLTDRPIAFRPRLGGESKASLKELTNLMKTPRWPNL